MGKECFTCSYKCSEELAKEQRAEMYAEAKAKGVRLFRAPELVFHCSITGKKISQIDPACSDYSGDSFMENIRKDISKSARKLREELNF